MYKKKKPLLHNKNAIKVSPFSYGTGCFHRTDDTTNARFKSVGYFPLFGTIIYQINITVKKFLSLVNQTFFKRVLI